MPLPKSVSRKVSRLRLLVRLYLLLEGVAAIVLLLGVAYWVGLAIDWVFEPSAELRIVQGIVVACAAIFLLVHFLLARLWRPLPSTSLALLLERNYPELKEGLVTTVEAATQSQSLADGHQTMLRQTSRETAEAMPGVQLSKIFNYRPLSWKLIAAAALAISIIVFSVVQFEAHSFWLERMRLSEAPWPRRVQLAVVGFVRQNGQKVVKIARDDDYQLLVNASLLDGHEVPDRVEIRYRLNDGRRGRDFMTKVGESLLGRDDLQQYRYTFKNVVTDLKFDLIGGDDRIHGLQLKVVERPQIESMSVECEYPTLFATTAGRNRREWTCRIAGRNPRRIPFSGQ